MREFAKQLASMAGAAFAAACCLGMTAALSALMAVGAGFLIKATILIPLYVLLLALSVWLLYRSARAHDNLRAFWIGAAGAAIALLGLWINSLLVYAGLLLLVTGSVTDFIRARRRATA